MAAEGGADAQVKVWDRPVRLAHWALALSCAAAWFTGDIFPGWHHPIGYAALAIATARIAWGIGGRGYACLSQFVRGPRATFHYARAVVDGTAPRYLGHNPLGGWMALALWSCVAALGFSGWLYTTDMFWGTGWLSLAHEMLAWVLVVLVALHVAGVVATGRKHGENLVAAMWTGRKRRPAPEDVS